MVEFIVLKAKEQVVCTSNHRLDSFRVKETATKKMDLVRKMCVSAALSPSSSPQGVWPRLGAGQWTRLAQSHTPRLSLNRVPTGQVNRPLRPFSWHM